MSFNGWMLSEDEKDRMFAIFPPRFPIHKATHVTKQIDEMELPLDADLKVVGYATDAEGVEALIVSVDGTTIRSDGLTYHMTLSLAEGRSAKESNEMIAKCGWKMVPFVPIESKAFLHYGGKYMTSPLTAV